MADEKSIPGIPRDIINAAMKDISEKSKGLVPSDKQASYYAYGGTIVRVGLAFLAGKGYGWATGVSGDQQDMIVWILLGFSVLAWGLIQKKTAAIRTWYAARSSAALSAHATQEAGTPVVVAVEPPPNKV